jgi:hypothetical protein
MSAFSNDHNYEQESKRVEIIKGLLHDEPKKVFELSVSNDGLKCVTEIRKNARGFVVDYLLTCSENTRDQVHIFFEMLASGKLVSGLKTNPKISSEEDDELNVITLDEDGLDIVLDWVLQSLYH